MMKVWKLLATLRSLLLVLLAVALVGGTACGDEETNDDPVENNQQTDTGQNEEEEETKDEFALVGIWGTTYSLTETITETHWDKAKIVEFDNAERWVITQNAADEDLIANKFNKIVWTPLNRGVTYYCMVEIGRNLLEQVKDSKVKADSSEPEKGGCPEGTSQTWTKLTKL